MTLPPEAGSPGGGRGGGRVELFLGDAAAERGVVEQGVDLGRSWHGGDAHRDQIGFRGGLDEVVGGATGDARVDPDADQRLVEDRCDEPFGRCFRRSGRQRGRRGRRCGGLAGRQRGGRGRRSGGGGRQCGGRWRGG